MRSIRRLCSTFQSKYVLKWAKCVWYFLFEEFLKSIEFMLLPSDPNVLTNEKFMISRVVFAVYHNDLLIASKKKANILNVKELMKAVFKI